MKWTISILVAMGGAQLLAQASGRSYPTTDERIRAAERHLKQAPRDSALRNELAGAYLQKMRETADGAYLERAAQIVTDILKTEPASFEARRREIEIAMQRHHFRRVVLLRTNSPGNARRTALCWALWVMR